MLCRVYTIKESNPSHSNLKLIAKYRSVLKEKKACSWGTGILLAPSMAYLNWFNILQVTQTINQKTI